MVTFTEKSTEAGVFTSLRINDITYATCFKAHGGKTVSIRATRKGLYPFQELYMDTDIEVVKAKLVADTIAALSKLASDCTKFFQSGMKSE